MACRRLLFAGKITWKQQGLDYDRHHTRWIEQLSNINEIQFAQLYTVDRDNCSIEMKLIMQYPAKGRTYVSVNHQEKYFVPFP